MLDSIETLIMIDIGFFQTSDEQPIIQQFLFYFLLIN